jgi:very-short-patch-repair endonuclease
LQEKMKEIARQFRKQPTPSEAILWKALKNRQLEERKFRRQQPIGAFIVDFFCAQERLIVEIDGRIHESQKESDRQRQFLLESLGLRFVRLDATKVETDLASCLETIRATFTPLSPTPLYPCGRGAGGEGATVIAWLWARTVKCPNPACGCQMPLVRSFQLSTKKGKEAWVEPVINREQTPPAIQFEVKTGKGKALEGTVNRKGAICIACGTPVPFDHVRSEGKAGRMGAQLMAIVAEGDRGRIYQSPNPEHTNIALKVKPEWVPDADLPHNPRDFKTPNYGMKTFGDLFTPRQLVALTTFSDLVTEAREKIKADAVAAGMVDDEVSLNDGATGATAYADAIATYLGLSLDKGADYWNNICTWHINNPSC